MAVEGVLMLLSCTLGLEPGAAQCAPVEITGLTPPDGSPGDLFGQSVAIDGDTLVVGSPRDDDNGLNSGSAYIFVRETAGTRTWRRSAKLLPSDGEAGDEFGQGVSIYGDVIVVGARVDDDQGTASGSAYVFQREEGETGSWIQVAKLLASDGSPDSLFGDPVCVHGLTVIVGAYRASVSGFPVGRAYVFERDEGGPNQWGEVAKLQAPNPTYGDNFGGYVGLWRDVAIVGAPGDDEKAWTAGAAYVFYRDAGGPNQWGQVKKIFASDASGGDQFGAVAISGTTALVGAGTDDQNGQSAGSAYVFERDEGGPDNWGQVVKIFPEDPAPHDQFGSVLSIHADAAVIGSPLDVQTPNADPTGSAYLFYRHMGGANHWGQIAKLLPADIAPLDQFGFPAISGDTIVVGATKGVLPGAAYVFESTLAYPPSTYCTSKPSSSAGCVPNVGATGVASATSGSGFTVQARDVPGGSLGVFLYSHSGASAPRLLPFGVLCVSSPHLYKSSPLTATGTLGACDGVFSFDWNQFASTVIGPDPLSTQPGTSVDGQYWYRVPAEPGTAYLTEALGFVVCR